MGGGAGGRSGALTNDADGIRHAFIISAYKLPRNLARLVAALRTDATAILIGVDAQTDRRMFETMRREVGDWPNVRFLPRHRSKYRSFGHVRFTLKGVATLEAEGIAYDFLSLLTGQDYPIKPNSVIASYLAARQGHSFLKHIAMPNPDWRLGGMDRLERAHFYVGARSFAVPRRNHWPVGPRVLPYGLAPWSGSGYWTMCGEHARYVHRFVQSHPDLVTFFRRVDIPDEIFFQTILANSPFRDQLVDDDLRFIDWSRDNEWPAVLTTEDLPALQGSPKLFARKFDATRDAEVLDAIDEQLREAPR